MLNRKLILGVLLAATLGGAAVPAMARTNVDLIVNFGPPAPRYEHVVPRHGHVWSPGYWNWHSNRYVWVGGYWTRERPGYYWDSPRWVQSSHGWHFHQGRWNEGRRHYSHDRDRDGIPNYRDRYPNDRDNDGIPDYRDRTPNGRHHGASHYRDSDRDGIPNYRDRRPYDYRR